MKRVVVASENPVKLAAALCGFQQMFPDESFEVQGVRVASGVADQPMSDEETLLGASNRAKAAKALAKEADYWVGIEGGLDERVGTLEAMAWAVVLSPTLQGKGRTATFTLPLSVAQLIREGKELADATDIIFKLTNSRHSVGAIGALTESVIDRAAFNETAVVMALIPFKNTTLYTE